MNRAFVDALQNVAEYLHILEILLIEGALFIALLIHLIRMVRKL
jgi:hypothetical protein